MLINFVLVGSIQVEHFERWAQDARVKVMRPNTMNNYGAVLDDIGMEGMLNHLMLRYLKSMAAGTSFTLFSPFSQIDLLFLHYNCYYRDSVFLTDFCDIGIGSVVPQCWWIFFGHSPWFCCGICNGS